MTTSSDLRMVVRLALLTEDRTKAEQKALERVCRRLDREHNRQTPRNPAIGDRYRWPHQHPCTYPGDHGKDCPCRGDRVGYTPDGGWSFLEQEARG